MKVKELKNLLIEKLTSMEFECVVEDKDFIRDLNKSKSLLDFILLLEEFGWDKQASIEILSGTILD